MDTIRYSRRFWRIIRPDWLASWKIYRKFRQNIDFVRPCQSIQVKLWGLTMHTLEYHLKVRLIFFCREPAFWFSTISSGVAAAFIDDMPLKEFQNKSQIDENAVKQTQLGKPQVPAGLTDNERFLRRPWPENDDNLKKFTSDYGCKMAVCASGLRSLVCSLASGVRSNIHVAIANYENMLSGETEKVIVLSKPIPGMVSRLHIVQLFD